MTFAGTAFTDSGLVNGDTITGVTLTARCRHATATVRVRLMRLCPARGGTGLGNYTISYVNGSLTVNPAALTITADSTSKTYGQTATFAGTSSRTSGLVNGDTVTGVTVTSTGAAATATVAGSPYTIVPSASGGYGPGQLHDHLRQRQPDGQPGGADDHGGQHEQDVRPDGDLRGH